MIAEILKKNRLNYSFTFNKELNAALSSLDKS